MGAGHPEGPPQPGQWKIALKLKPEIEAKAKANQGTRTDLSMNSPKGYPPTDTRKEMAKAVGIGEQTMGRIAQLAENVPKSLKDALENKELPLTEAGEPRKLSSGCRQRNESPLPPRSVGCARNRPDGCRSRA